MRAKFRDLAAGLLLMGAGAILSGCADDRPGKCEVVTYGRMIVLNDHGSPIVRAAINGYPVAFIVDSGAFLSMIDPKYAAKLDIGPAASAGIVHGVGGDSFLEGAIIHDLDLGSSHAENIALGIGGKFNGTIQGLPIVGLFGGDFLSNYDMVVDMPDHQVQLLRSNHCASPTPEWLGRVDHFHITDAGGSDNTKIGLDIQINGKTVEAFLDTGAAVTTISRATARDIGVTQEMLDRDPVVHLHGISGDATKAYRHRFDTLTIGDDVMRNVTLTVSGGMGDVDALVGADFLRHYRIWIRMREHTGYFQHDRDIPENDPIRSHAL